MKEKYGFHKRYKHDDSGERIVDKEVLQKAQGFDKSQLPLSFDELASVYMFRLLLLNMNNEVVLLTSKFLL